MFSRLTEISIIITKKQRKMPEKKIRLFVFDMAGTTVNEDNVVYKTLREAVNDQGHDFSLETVLLIGGGQEKSQAIRDILRSAQLNGAELEKQTQKAYENFLQQLKTAYENLEVTPYPGAEEIFADLRSKDVKVVLNTGYNRKTAESLLRKLNWREGRDFDLLVTADEVNNSRPAPDMIVYAMEKTGVSDPRQVAKIGDSIIDIEEGKNAGCGLTLGITTGAQTRAQLQTAAPDAVVDALLEIEDKVT